MAYRPVIASISTNNGKTVFETNGIIKAGTDGVLTSGTSIYESNGRLYIGIAPVNTTAKLQVNGNLFVANGSVWAGNLSITNTTPSTSSSSGALTVSGGIGVANGAVIAGNVGIGTSSIGGFTNNSLAVFGSTTSVGNIFIKDRTTPSGIVFNDGSFQPTSAIVATYSYDNRTALRSLTPLEGTLASVDSLGIFVYRIGSDEPDDDETCFATNTGRWLIQTIHPELAEALTLYDEDFYNEQRFLFGSAYQGQIAVGANYSTYFDISVVNAFPGDRVIVNPPTNFGNQLSVYAFVYDRNVVRVYINNSSSNNTGYSNPGYWKVLVIKEY